MGLLGDVNRALFGGSKKKEESGNLAYPWLKDTYAPMAQGGVDSFGQFGNALGIGGGGFAGQQGAYQNFLNNSGYDFVMDNAMQGVTNSAAGKYLLRSGATAKALQDRSVGINKTFFENWLDRLAQSSQLGLGAGGIIADAGQYGKGSGTESSGGLGKAIGSIFAAFCDRRLKSNIVRIGELEDGLPVHEFEYRQDAPFKLPAGRFRGVLADEVQKFRPKALGPKIKGYATIIDKSLLPEKI